MPRVLAVTPYPTRAIELRRQEFEVFDVRGPADLDPWEGGQVSAAFVDLMDLGEVRSVISAVRASVAQVPIVVLGPQEEQWQALEEDGYTLLVAPPVSFEQVAGALRSLIGPAPSLPPEPPAAPPPAPPAPPAPPELVQFPEPTSSDAAEDPVGAKAPPEEPVRVAVPLPLPIDEHQPTTRRQWWTALLRRSASAGALPDEDWRRRASLLIEQISAVPTVVELGQDFCAELTKTCPADAAAVLVRAGGSWHVEAHVGLRPLEGRLGVEEHDWLGHELRDGPPVIVVPDTDLLRSELAFTPLASRPRLLAACFGEERSLVLLGRAGAPFSKGDVALVTGRLAEFAPRLADALEARVVAHEMVRFL